MTPACNENICGFEVLPFPEKPGYLPISDEEFRRDTLAAWCRGGYREKIAAALYGGEREWATLCKDSDPSVRGAVACRANEATQLKMLTDPAPMVRKYLARYGTDKVRTAAVKGWETDTEVLMEIAKWGGAATKRKVMELAWHLPETLKQVIPYLSPGCIKTPGAEGAAASYTLTKVDGSAVVKEGNQAFYVVNHEYSVDLSGLQSTEATLAKPGTSGSVAPNLENHKDALADTTTQTTATGLTALVVAVEPVTSSTDDEAKAELTKKALTLIKRL